MIRILGSPKRLCDGLTRRDWLHVGGLGMLGVGLSDFLRLREAQARGPRARHFGQARACILLYKYGSPPQHETFDPKPDAPAEVQGEMKVIATAVPGIRICEHLPRTARIMDRLTVVRSLTHPYPLHGTVYAMTGIPDVDTRIEARPRDPRQWPFVGSVVDYLEDRRTGGKTPAVPRNVALPFPLGSRTEIPPPAGPYATWLGARYDPAFTDFRGRGARPAPAVRGRVFHDPYLSIGPADRITLGAGGEAVTPAALDARRSLLSQFDRARSWLEADDRVATFGRHQQLAYTLLTSGPIHRALDVGREPAAVRERYGMTLFGQAALAARRTRHQGPSCPQDRPCPCCGRQGHRP
jgi:hypothetical protein